ncbi:MAG: hypothetical protein GTN64_05470 [Candidatus Latescibacteria bacterium]|nr:hypothetical protein [Candidatus Latescibacterota bacterium]NIO78059.1 hypothetical protein [Candidatus Latescibacterota bacterium]
MANEARANPAVMLNILGTDHTLKYSMHSVSQLKKLCGVNLIGADSVDLTDPDIIIGLVWAGLIASHKQYRGKFVNGEPDETIQRIIEAIGFEMTGSKVQECASAVREALLNSFGDSVQEAQPGPEASGKNA